MRFRITAAAVFVTAAGTFALTGVAHGQTDERDCEDFSSQAQAQAVLDSPRGDPERLDADRDGQACEIWFANRDDAGATTGSSGAADPAGLDAGLDAGGDAGSDQDTSDEIDASSSPAAGSAVAAHRQVSPVPRGGIDTGRDTARIISGDIGWALGSAPAPPAIVLVAAFAVAGTAAAGAMVAARRPIPARGRGPAHSRPRTAAPIGPRPPGRTWVRRGDQAVPVVPVVRAAARSSRVAA